MNNQEILEKEIDLIQSCINRMAQNSFIVKGWLISLVTVVLAFLPKTINFDIRTLCIILFIATICFWYLDAYFLKIEKLFRWKYKWVITNRRNTLKLSYDLNPHNSKMWSGGTKEPYIISIMFSKTLSPIYLLVIAIEIFVFINTY